MKGKLAGLLAVIAISLTCSCSVKEDRRDCPCYLVLDFCRLDKSQIGNVGLCLQSGEGFLFRDTVLPENFDNEYVVEVPRAQIGICAVSGGELEIPTGEQCPPLYMHCWSIRAFADRVVETVTLHKNYSLVNVRMLSGNGTPRNGLDVGIAGNVCGYDESGGLLTGEFSYEGSLSADGGIAIRVPRQADNSLSLRIIDEGDVVREFALGEYISSSGFDWTSEDLEDIDVTVNFALATVTIRIKQWETTYVFGVEI